MKLEREMTYRLTVTGPLSPTDGSPRGPRQYWVMAAGTLTGARINANIAMPGSDWMSVGPDGFWRPNVRVPFITDDDAVILLHYTGLVQQSETFVAAAKAGRETGWADQYMRMAMTFDTGAARYAWLNQSVRRRGTFGRCWRARVSDISHRLTSDVAK